MEKKTFTFTLTKNAITNLIVNYADEFLRSREAETTEDYAYATGFCAAAESWMKTLGISPESNMVQDILYLRKGGSL